MAACVSIKYPASVQLAIHLEYSTFSLPKAYRYLQGFRQFFSYLLIGSPRIRQFCVFTSSPPPSKHTALCGFRPPRTNSFCCWSQPTIASQQRRVYVTRRDYFIIIFFSLFPPPRPCVDATTTSQLTYSFLPSGEAFLLCSSVRGAARRGCFGRV